MEIFLQYVESIVPHAKTSLTESVKVQSLLITVNQVPSSTIEKVR